MSTGLDKQDIQQMLKENLNNLRTSPVMETWRQGRGKTVVTIFCDLGERYLSTPLFPAD